MNAPTYIPSLCAPLCPLCLCGERKFAPLEDSYLVSTPENIEISYVPAGMGTRFLAALLDSLILAVLLLGILIAGLVVAVATAGLGETVSWLIFALIVLLMFVTLFGYYIFFETVWRGQSPGKRMMGLRVMRDDGLPLGFTGSVIRNLIRFFDLLPLAYGFGIVAMFFNRRWKRLGDMAAGTIVIREPQPLPPQVLQLPVHPDLPLAATQLRERFTSREYELIREYLQRYYSLSPAAQDRLGRSLAALAEDRTGLPRGQTDPARYLSTLMALQAQ